MRTTAWYPKNTGKLKVIAPAPDYKWHVAGGLDVTLADNRPVLELDGKTILLLKNKKLWPKKEELEWRMQHLLLRNYRCE